MSEEWGPWIEHDGRGCPVPRGVWLMTQHEFANGETVMRVRRALCSGGGAGRSWDWSNFPEYTKVLRYRIRKPRGLTILERIASQPQERVEA